MTYESQYVLADSQQNGWLLSGYEQPRDLELGAPFGEALEPIQGPDTSVLKEMKQKEKWSTCLFNNCYSIDEKSRTEEGRITHPGST